MAAKLRIVSHDWPFTLQWLSDGELKDFNKFVVETLIPQTERGVSFISSSILAPYKFVVRKSSPLPRRFGLDWIEYMVAAIGGLIRGYGWYYYSTSMFDTVRVDKYKDADVFYPNVGYYRVGRDNPTMAIDILYEFLWHFVSGIDKRGLGGNAGLDFSMIIETDEHMWKYYLGAGGPVRQLLVPGQVEMVRHVGEGQVHMWSAYNVIGGRLV